MFFHNDFFQKRKGGFGLAWLAATLGTQGSKFRRIPKKELVGCDVVKTCRKLIEPEEPLALRLSSNLMLGVARIYSHQWALLHQDATSTSTALRKATTTSFTADDRAVFVPNSAGLDATGGRTGPAGKGRERIDQGAAGAGRSRDGINLNLNMNAPEHEMGMVGLGMGDLIWQNLQDELGEHLPAELGRGATPVTGRKRGRPLEADEDDGEGEFSVGTPVPRDEDYVEGQRRKKSKTEQHPRKKREVSNIAREEDINLPAYHDDFDYQNFDLPAPIELEAGAPDEFALDLDLNLDLGTDLNLGLDGLLEPDTTADQSRSRASLFPGAPSSSAALGGTEGPADTSLAGAEARDAGETNENLEYAGNDQLFDDFGERPPPLVLGVPGRRDPFSPPLPAASGDRSATHPPTPPPSSPREDADSSKTTAKTGSKKPSSAAAKKATVKDRVIELASSDIRDARDRYSGEMRRLGEVKKREVWEKLGRDQARWMMFDPPRDAFAPALKQFLGSVMSVEHIRKPASQKGAKRPAADAVAARTEVDMSKRPRPGFVREGTAVSSQLGRGGPEGKEGFVGREYEDLGFGGPDFGDFAPQPAFSRAGSEIPPSEVGRRAEPFRRSLSRDFENVSQRGRERAASVSYNQSMPWNRDEGMSDILRGVHGGAPSSSQRSFSVRHSLGNFSADRIARSRSPSFGFVDVRPAVSPMAMAGQPRAEDLQGSPAGSGSKESEDTQNTQATEGDTQRAARLQLETARFLDYAKRQASLDREGTLFFSDVVPVASTAPAVAAMAFYHTLILATKKLITVRGQAEPYGEIELAIPDFVY